MRFIRGRPAKGKPPKIICSGCGKRAREAGVAVADAVERFYGPDANIDDMCLDEDEMQPLCKDCVAALERAERRS